MMHLARGLAALSLVKATSGWMKIRAEYCIVNATSNLNITNLEKQGFCIDEVHLLCVRRVGEAGFNVFTPSPSISLAKMENK